MLVTPSCWRHQLRKLSAQGREGKKSNMELRSVINQASLLFVSGVAGRTSMQTVEWVGSRAEFEPLLYMVEAARLLRINRQDVTNQTRAEGHFWNSDWENLTISCLHAEWLATA